MSLLAGDPSGPRCSRAGCHADASWQVVWRNPRIHTADRRKVWLACDEHSAYLHDYLAARDFPVHLEAFTDGGVSSTHPSPAVAEA